MILFDIIVPTYRRYHELPRFFMENMSLNTPEVMFWIVDDGSPEADPSVIPNWPNVHFNMLKENKGQAHARNIAMQQGSAPFVISLDDDAWFEQGNTALQLIESFMKDFPDAACGMFNIATPNSNYNNSDERGRELPLHVTCGCVYRREVLESIGAFSGFLHSGAEETDISLRIFKAGHTIRFIPEVKVYHNFMPASRPVSWYYNVRFNTTRNDLLIVLMYYPAVLVIPFVAGKLLNHLSFTIRHKVSAGRAFWVTLQAFGAFILMSPQALSRRNPLTRKRFGYWRSLQRKTK